VDELTGVASRFQFDRTLITAFEQALAGVCTLSVALFDIDALDEINASYGREAGDAVLINVAGRLERAFMPLGGMVARYHGSRFGVILPRIDRATAVKAAEAARAAVAGSPVQLVAARTGAPRELPVSVSAGVASVDDRLARRFDGPSGLTLVLEQAVKAAQRAGRNTMRVYAPALAA
jgi:diguanylate cyclase (GGDEF)-like protein